MNRFIILFVMALVMSACSESTEPAPSAQDISKVVPASLDYYDDGTGIQWLNGDVDAAFAMAAQLDKPLFLYWGAEWCPPCHAIRATVFNTPAFRERAAQFVAVYLDGDTADAQINGERFGVMGYPTVIVFTPSGAEVTRIPNGIDIEAFAEVLDLAMSRMAPVADIVARTLAGAAPSSADCKLFAFYSWGQDNERILAGDAENAVFQSMAKQCGPDHDDAHRLQLLYLSRLIATHNAQNANTEESAALGSVLAATERREALQRFEKLLADQQAVNANASTLIFESADIVQLLTEANSPERIALLNQLNRMADSIGNNAEMFAVDRLYASYAKISLVRMDDEEGPLSEALKAEILERVTWADTHTTDPHERQAVINAAANVLIDGGLEATAKDLLLREIERSKQPYYYMPTLADLAEEQGDEAGAIAWLKRAYDESRGPATRFQWGRYYVVGLIKMQPHDAQLIAEQAAGLIEELAASGGSLHHRNARVMDRLEQELNEWNAQGEHDAQLQAIRSSVQRVCPSMRVEDSRKRCEGFLTSA